VKYPGWGGKFRSSLRLLTAGLLVACALTPAAMAQGLVPADFFNAPIDPAAPTGVEANNLTLEAATGMINATGDVVVTLGGYKVSGQTLVYNRNNRDAHFVGAVTVRDPSGNVLETEDLKLTDGLKQAFLDALTINAYDGSRITADSAEYDAALRTFLTNANYAPCGDCIDAKGRRVGWSMTAATVTYNAEDGSLYMEQPRLEVLGVPVAWLPFLWLPDTSETALANVRMPTIGYSEQIGVKLEVPYTAYSSRWTDIVLTPTLVSNQGFLLGAEWIQRFDNGSFQIKASGLYQFNPNAFTFSEAQREWRGAVQTSGQFTPVTDWTAGWSYTAFTDAAYLDDYQISSAKSAVNEVYATNVTEDTYIDVRLQQFNLLGNVTAASQDQQAQALPNARFSHIQDLAPGYGRIEITGRLLGVRRGLDQKTTVNGVPYTFGYAGNKVHANFQAGWQNQYIGGGGFVATPYLGGRADVAYYDGTSPTLPGETTLWSATPIAAMDVRFPMAGSDGSTVHLVEPIVQLAYRGSDTSLVGITNDDAQSFVFDDTNLFSYNRFSGSDRQETGLRANVGGRYLANFANGSYVEVVAGQSFQLAGANAFASPDHAQTGVGSGMDVSPSYAVLGAYGSFIQGVGFGGKLQIDPSAGAITRAGLGATYSAEGYSAMVDYTFIAGNTATGQLKDQHEIGAEVGVPVDDYWTVRGGAYWDLSAGSFLQASAGLQYDDGYVVIGANATRTGATHTSPNETRFTATFKIRAPAGLDVGYSGSLPVPQF